jgi:hypothetical protein
MSFTYLLSVEVALKGLNVQWLRTQLTKGHSHFLLEYVNMLNISVKDNLNLVKVKHSYNMKHVLSHSFNGHYELAPARSEGLKSSTFYALLHWKVASVGILWHPDSHCNDVTCKMMWNFLSCFGPPNLYVFRNSALFCSIFVWEGRNCTWSF